MAPKPYDPEDATVPEFTTEQFEQIVAIVYELYPTPFGEPAYKNGLGARVYCAQEDGILSEGERLAMRFKSIELYGRRHPHELIVQAS